MRERPGVNGPLRQWLRFVLRWIVAPALIGGGLLAATMQQALLTGARDAVLLAAVTLGSGHLTILPKPEGTAVRIIRDAGPLYTNMALMQMPARTVNRLVLPVTVEAKGAAVEAELTGHESSYDPQPLLLARFVTAGAWPGHGTEAAGGSESARAKNGYDVVLGAGLAGRLGVTVGNPIRVRTGTGSARRAFEGRVAALVHTGLGRVDDVRLWSNAEAARELLTLPRSAREEAVTSLAIYLDQPEGAVEWLVAVRRATLPPDVEILTWRQVDPRTLPTELWVLAQQRAARAGFIAAAGGALLAALLVAVATFAGRSTAAAPSLPRWGALRIWLLVGPALIGITAGVAATAALWAGALAHPLSATGVFRWLGPELNTTGDLTGAVLPVLSPEQALPWLGESTGVYAVIVLGLAWLLSRAGKS